MADYVKVWWLELANEERLLAISFDDSRSQPFKQAKSYCSSRLRLKASVERSVSCESCADVGERGWSTRIRNIKLCFEELPQYQEMHLVVASACGMSAVGLGSSKDKRLRAAYLSLALTSIAQEGFLGEKLPLTLQILVHACLEAPRLTASPKLLTGTRLFFSADPSKRVLQDIKGYTVVWHIKPGFQNCEFEQYVKKADAEARFCDFRNGPYNTILFDQAGETLSYFGNQRRRWTDEMKAFWQTVIPIKQESAQIAVNYRACFKCKAAALVQEQCFCHMCGQSIQRKRSRSPRRSPSAERLLPLHDMEHCEIANLGTAWDRILG
jgi:hypothetical protein